MLLAENRHKSGVFTYAQWFIVHMVLESGRNCVAAGFMPALSTGAEAGSSARVTGEAGEGAPYGLLLLCHCDCRAGLIDAC